MPFAFTSDGTRWVGTDHIIQAFKTRAGHLVLASLEEDLELTGGRLREAKQIWREVTLSEDPGNQNDGYCMLTDDANSEWPATRVLDRYLAMAEPVRKDAPHLDSAFWVFLKGNGGEVGRLGETGDRYRRQLILQPASRIFPHNPILSRVGLNLSCVRKSVLSQRRAQGGSIVAVRAPAGHAGRGVLMPHYLNTPAINAQLDTNIRKFQNSLQALIVRDLDQDTVSLRLKTSVSELERLRSIAVSSGIASALGLVSAPDLDTPIATLEFRPTNDRLRELYLVHRALIAMRQEYRNRGRWVKDWLPLLALAKAIGREIFQAGLGPTYRSAARAASRELRRGAIVLPYLED
jgi:hypothetical protein